jgi:FlaA1/EpsC-like NDP-sugar epimerase
VIGDVRNRQSVRQAIRGTDIVFHTDIAEVMVEALSPKKSVPVQTVVIQPGEKIREVLVSQAEAVRTIEDECTYIILPQIDLDAARSFYGQRSLVAFSEFISDGARRLSKPENRSLLLRTGWLAS